MVKIKKENNKISKETKEDKKTFDSTQIKIENLSESDSTKKVDSDVPILEQQTKKRGRPSKAEQQAKQAELDSESQVQALKISEDVFTPVFKLLNKILVSKYGEIVKLDDDEITSLKYYMSLISAKYLPSVIQKFGAEFALGMLTLTITADKVIKYQEFKLKEKKREDSQTER